MSGGLGPIPPRDPEHDRRLRESVRRGRDRGLLAGLVFFSALVTQGALALPLGVWAAGEGMSAGYAAFGLLLVLVAAHALGFALLLLLGSASLLLSLPRLFRRRRPDAEVRVASETSPLSLGAAIAMAAVHALFLLLGAGVLGVLLAMLSKTIGLGDVWRFLSAAAALALLTPAVLLAWARSDA